MPLPSWTPDLPALDLLLSVAALGSVGRAAAEHRITQPSASARLARLERQLGVPLLVRTSRGSTLTPGGEAVVAWARTVVEAAGALTDGVTALRSRRRAKLRVAASLTVAEYLLPQWMLTLRRRHPDLDTAVAVANSHDVCDRVRSGSADLGFIESPDIPEGIGATAIGSDRLALVVAAGYPLAARAAAGVDVRDLLEQPLLLREPGSGTRETFLHALHAALIRATSAAAAVDPTHVTDLGSTTTIVATALAGGGIGVVSARAVAAELAGGRLVEIRVDGLDLRRPLRAIWLGTTPGDVAAELVVIAAGDHAARTASAPGRG